MIKSFGNDLAKTIFNGSPLSRKQARQFPVVLYERARIKLALVDQASRIEDFYFPPANHFEALSGNWQGFYSIRIHQKPWRVVFKWEDSNAYEVQIVDYH